VQACEQLLGSEFAGLPRDWVYEIAEQTYSAAADCTGGPAAGCLGSLAAGWRSSGPSGRRCVPAALQSHQHAGSRPTRAAGAACLHRRQHAGA
jgi:hypothetical protein